MRVSTQGDKQSFNRQEDLIAPQVDVMYSDRMSGSQRKRPELDRMLEDLGPGDTVLIHSIDRLSRSTRDLLEIVDKIKEADANLISITDSWLDTSATNPMSDFLLTVMGALSELERKQIVNRVNEGLAVAKKNGVKLGRPKADKKKVQLALKLYDDGEHTVSEIMELTDLSRKTIYNYVNKREAEKYID